MANISEEKWIEMLEKKADGSYIAKYPKVKSKSGVTFDEHLAEDVHHRIVVGGFVHDGTEVTKKVVVGFRPKYVECRLASSGGVASIMIFDDTNDRVLMANKDSFTGHKKDLLGISIHNDGFSIPLGSNNHEISYIAIG